MIIVDSDIRIQITCRQLALGPTSFLHCNSQANGRQVVNQMNAVTRLYFSVFYACAAAHECKCVEYAYFQENGA